MTIDILMPALSPTMTQGNLVKWHKKEGESVAAGDLIAEIETDKATLDFESVDEGVMGRILVEEGAEDVPVNTVIARLLEEGEDASALEQEAAPAPAPAPAAGPAAALDAPPPAEAAEAPSASPLAGRIAALAGLELAGIAGTGPRGRIVKSDVEAALAGAGAPVPAAMAARAEGERIFASPLARRMAEQAGLELANVVGTGPEGRIVKSDIEAALAGGARPAPRAAPHLAVAPLPGAESELVKMSSMRKVIAERMAASKSTVPHFYLTVDCEIDALLAMRAELNALQDEAKVSVNDFVIRACALALREVPEANVSFEGDGMMRRFNTVDISVAVALDGGLVTPVVRSADRKSLPQIAAEMADLAARARDGKLMPEEYQGGSFSLSNLGMFGVKQFDAVINPPQACILAVGAGEKRPVVKDGAIVPATVMSCTLSCDHRVVDGAIGARLLGAVKYKLEHPLAMVL